MKSTRKMGLSIETDLAEEIYRRSFTQDCTPSKVVNDLLRRVLNYEKSLTIPEQNDENS